MASSINPNTTSTKCSFQGTEFVNGEGAVETRVDTVDYRSSAGQGQEQRGDKVQVIHQSHPGESPRIGGGALSTVTAAVASTIHSVKDAIQDNNNNPSPRL